MKTPSDSRHSFANRNSFPPSSPVATPLLRTKKKKSFGETPQQSTTSPITVKGGHGMPQSLLYVIPKDSSDFRWITLCLFLKVTTESISFSVLPYFVYYDLLASPSALGWSISGFTVAQMIATLLYGRLSDAFGRRWLLLFSFLLNALAFYCMAKSYSFVSFFLSRLLVGFSAISIALVHAMIVDITHLGNRGIANNQMRSLLSLGFILGPACGGLVYYLFNDRRKCLLLCSVGAVGVFLLGFAFLPETLPKEMRRPLMKIADLKIIEKFSNSNRSLPDDNTKKTDHSTEASASNSLPRCTWEFILICLVRFFFSAAGACMGGTYNLLIADTYKPAQPDFTMGKIFVISGLCMLIYQNYFYPLIEARLSCRVILLYACSLQALGIYFTWLSVSFSLWIHIVVQCSLYFAAYSLADPTIATLASLYASKTYQGTAHGILVSCHVLANVLSPILFGYLYSITAYLPFLSAACIAIIPVIILLFIPKPKYSIEKTKLAP